jgi:carboxylesterase type B
MRRRWWVFGPYRQYHLVTVTAMLSVLVAAFLALAGSSNASGRSATKRAGCASVPSNAKTSLTLLYQNNLNLTDDANHIGAILLDPQSSFSAAEARCSALGESLLTKAALQAHADDFYRTFNYLAYSGREPSGQHYLIANGTVSSGSSAGQLSFQDESASGASLQQPLPVLCTQSATSNTADNAVASSANEITIPAAGNTYVGYRNQKSWRFLGIRYADPPSRWTYSVPYSGKGQVLNATQYGSQCIQPYANPPGSEDCLFLNIQTPYIPKAGSTSKDGLRPVLFYIHGGGFTGGSGAADNTDGGQYASREDIVTVTMNYRLSTLGFLAVPGTNITGNYGIQDQNLALKWVVANIATFGGDPNQITINGDSAGAGSVRAHLGSPKSIGLFQGAITMSNLGGGVDLGLSGDYATTYGTYYTIAQSYQASSALFGEAGCTSPDSDASAAIACLKTVDAKTLVNLPTVARYVVQDGIYVDTPELIVSERSDKTAHVPVMFGDCRDEGASFSTYPHPAVNSTVAGIEAALGINAQYAQAVIDSGLFPNPNTGNVTLDAFNISARIATDNQFLCWNQASAYAGTKTGAFTSAYFFISDRTGIGYDPNNVGNAPVEPGYPLGDPDLPYFRVHSSDISWAFGWASFVRDADDLYSIEMTSSYFASFIRSGQPNPPETYLQTRGYSTVLQGTREAGPWGAIESDNGPIQHLDWPGFSSDFKDKPQCAWLNYSIDYFLVAGH